LDDFDKCVTEKVSNQKILYFPTSPNSCFCTTWETGNPEIASFHLNAAYSYQNRFIYVRVTARQSTTFFRHSVDNTTLAVWPALGANDPLPPSWGHPCVLYCTVSWAVVVRMK